MGTAYLGLDQEPRGEPVKYALREFGLRAERIQWELRDGAHAIDNHDGSFVELTRPRDIAEWIRLADERSEPRREIRSIDRTPVVVGHASQYCELSIPLVANGASIGS
ncbi:hypothetical protein GCM10009789_36650 [Kribbella sancticallisti]|uniref:Uncharacterized protein n=1 Tax=Kribbella sancticallisti TaxID=460087 RepID=A0ABP4PHV7_9ACTN